jgi:transposase
MIEVCAEGVQPPTPTHTMKAKRKRHDPEFKARVALEALKGIQTLPEIAREFDLHPAQVAAWKRIMTAGAAGVFGSGPRGGSEAGDSERERDALHAKIGQLDVAVDFLRRKSKQLGL